MALRSRPLKFNVWQVNCVQKRSCRSPLQTRLADHGGLHRQHTISICGNAQLDDESKGRSQSERKPQLDVIGQHALISFVTKDIQLQPFKKSPALFDDNTCVKDTVINFLPENHITSSTPKGSLCGIDQFRCPYVYKPDDILFGRRNSSVNSAKTQVDPLLVSDFFKQQMPLATNNNALCATPEAQPEQPNPTESAYSDNDSSITGTSDFVHFMEYFMTGAFSLEKNEDLPLYLNPSVSQGETQMRNGMITDVPGVVHCSDISDQGTKQPTSDPGDNRKPTLEQLTTMQDYLAENLPKLFVTRHEYRMYTKDVVFENNFFTKPYTTVGLNNYAMQLAKLRIIAHVRFANVRIQVLKITTNEKMGTVKVRWRLSGIPQSRAFMFWKFLPMAYKDTKQKESEWHDGISTLYLNHHGLIAKHKMDKMMPEEEALEKEPVIQSLNPAGF